MPAAAVIDDAGSELAELLAELVAFPTESTTPNLELIRWFADHAESNGGRVTVLNGDVGRANLLASFGPQIAGGVMLSGHTDVVPAGTGWATDPYAVTRTGDALHGRGTADMKGFIAAMIRTITQFRDVELRRPLHIALSFDEEIGCVGVRQALEVIAGRDDVSPEVVVIGEPTMMRPRHSHMGKLAHEIVCTTTAAHSSLSHSKPSAITIAARLVSELDDLQQQYRPVGDPEVTFNCGSISGGSALNVIAERCTFAFETRHTVDHDPDVVLQSLMEIVERERVALAQHGGSIDVTEITRYPALRTASDDPWLRVIERIADAGAATSISYGTEGGLFAAALAASVVICGPGDIAVAHRPDEYVTIDQLLRCERFLCGVVQQICVDPVAEG
ncbi:MAG TPA: acetylornithine deacetylase [Ilumatobacteraceae bacterium]|nr:acetylornithine deacetylase [Ilumatobacteraceae bacterium]